MTDTPADDQATVLSGWVEALVAELSAADLAAGAATAAPAASAVDIEAVLSLAGVAAHAVVRPAAPLTTYVVGYAAGLAVAAGADPAAAFTQSAEAAAAAANRWQADHGA